MVRLSLVLVALLSAPAWAVGERISVPKGVSFAEQLHETLCISMECGGAVDASVTAKVVGGKAEIKVFNNAGQLKGTITAPLNNEGRISSMDLVSATSGIISAIEGPMPKEKVAAAEPTKAAKTSSKKALAAKAKKKSGLKLASKGRGAHTPG